jgi:dolichol-phosphate mannosyltransferase
MYIPVIDRLAAERRRLRRLFRFGVVGVTGIFINELALAVLVSGLGLNYVVGFLLSTQFSTLWNFAFFETWALKSTTYRNRRWQRLGMIMVVNNFFNVASVPILVLFTSLLGINYLVSNMLTLLIVFVVRFTIADWIWAPAREPRWVEESAS